LVASGGNEAEGIGEGISEAAAGGEEATSEALLVTEAPVIISINGEAIKAVWSGSLAS